MAYSFKMGPSLVPEAEHGRITLVERFERRVSLNASPGVTKNPNFEILHASGGVAVGDCVLDAKGGITLGCQDGTNNDDCILMPHLDSNMTAWTTVTWGSDQDTRWEAIIVPRVTLSEVVFWAGLKLTNVDGVATDSEQLYVICTDGVSSGALVGNAEVGGALTTVVSDIIPAVGGALHIQMSFDQDQKGRIWVNGQYIVGTTFTADDLIPYIGIASDATGCTGELTVRQCAISRKYA